MVLLWILFAIALCYLVYQGMIYIMIKRSAKELAAPEFEKQMKNQQLIDVRDRDSFNAGHIMGARNFSFYTLKEVGESLRHDRPIYLYAQTRFMEARSANILHKLGYKNIYILRGGYEQWEGKVKKTK